MPARPIDTPSRHGLATAALAAMLAAGTAGCSSLRSNQPTDAFAMAIPSRADAAAAPRTEADWRRQADIWAERHRANPNDPATAVNYAQALRHLGQRAQAVAVLERASIQHPKDMAVLGVYGRALAEAGNYQQALDVLSRAHTPDRPDWHILSAQGAVLDQMGRHEEAQSYYDTALKIVPGEPTVLSNLGLSYALAKDLTRAEATLRRAAARLPVDPRVRQNLALVLGLQGRYAEAETVARADLPPDEAAANVAYFRQMLSQQTATPGRTAAKRGNS